MRLLTSHKLQLAFTVLLAGTHLLAVAQEPETQPQTQQVESQSKQQQQPQQGGGSGFGGLLSGLLGTITKTAESTECPGKCIHALASLLCDEVREDIKCPAEGLRCCVDRRRPKPNPPTSAKSPQSNSAEMVSESEERTTEETTTTTKKKKKKKPATTERTSNPTQQLAASEKSAEAQFNNKADKFDDEDVEYDNESGDLVGGSSGSDTSRFNMIQKTILCTIATIFLGRVNLPTTLF